MQIPVQITLRDFDSCPVLETHIRQKANKLERYFDRISSCRVVVKMTQKHKHNGKLYNVRIDVTVPGTELVVTHKEDQDVYIALRDAFDAINKQLANHAHRRNGHVKTHEVLMHGTIARLVANEGYGFIEGMDGNEYYFSITNVSFPKFNQLIIGDEVDYIPTALSNGLQAQHVVKGKNNNHNHDT